MAQRVEGSARLPWDQPGRGTPGQSQDFLRESGFSLAPTLAVPGFIFLRVISVFGNSLQLQISNPEILSSGAFCSPPTGVSLDLTSPHWGLPALSSFAIQSAARTQAWTHPLSAPEQAACQAGQSV